MRIVGHRHTLRTKNISSEIESSSFDSVTKRMLSTSRTDMIKCPSCGAVIDFSMGVQWQGPDTFICSNCQRYLSMNLVHRALRDLGME